MPFVTGWATNTGVVREENQDSCYTRVHETPIVSAAVAVMCDGMGGLSDGAVASRLVCDAVEHWFDYTFVYAKKAVSLSTKDIIKQLSGILDTANTELVRYGEKNQVRVGTTASILLLLNGRYYIAHVGDSRVYLFSSNLRQLTDDDCVAAEKMRRGEINAQEYEESKERHVLTQCIGVNKKLSIHIYDGDYDVGDVFFLCSDGMYHNLTFSELSSMMIAQKKERGAQITTSIERTIDRMISRSEKDNLTGVIVCVT